MISLLLLPVIAITVLAIIHSYFGIHVIRRGIIFVDLALAQWAALGYLIAHALHIESELGKALIALALSAIAALILAFTQRLYKNPHDHKQEANIGVMYLLAIALATIILSTTGIEGHHFKEMLVGHLLFVSMQEIIIATFFYTLVGVAHWFFFKQMRAPSSMLWHFLFYASFGVIVTSSVKIAGVLVVFALLIIPALVSSKHQPHGFKTQLSHSLKMAIPVSVFGIFLGYTANIPLGYAVILSLCGLWAVSLLKESTHKERH